ncbi:MAG: hypothetical protein Q4B70_04050 [Lachnospiraceae bacterium]|nr:hypothetical protein [Lachnospiraceae bacterium]
MVNLGDEWVNKMIAKGREHPNNLGNAAVRSEGLYRIGLIDEAQYNRIIQSFKRMEQEAERGSDREYFQ